MTTFLLGKNCGGDIISRRKRVYAVRQVFLRGNILKLAILITGILSVLAALFTYFGQNVGNFVFSTGNTDYVRGLALSTEHDFRYSAPVIVTDPIKSAWPTTLAAIRLEEVLNKDGAYTTAQSNYIGFTYYLRNAGFETIDVRYALNMLKYTNNIDAAIRVLIYEERLSQATGGTFTQYMKYEDYDYAEFGYVPNEKGFYETKYGNQIIPFPETTYFMDSLTVMRKEVKDFRPGEIIKYSIVVWVEGWDPDATDRAGADIRNGELKMQMNYSILDKSKL